MLIAICIVGFRNVEDIVRCFASLEVSTYRQFRVVICENGGPGAAERGYTKLELAAAAKQRTAVAAARADSERRHVSRARGAVSGVDACVGAWVGLPCGCTEPGLSPH